jgi:hypothetical protein
MKSKHLTGIRDELGWAAPTNCIDRRVKVAPVEINLVEDFFCVTACVAVDQDAAIGKSRHREGSTAIVMGRTSCIPGDSGTIATESSRADVLEM